MHISKNLTIAVSLIAAPVSVAQASQVEISTSGENPVLTLSVTGSAQGQPDRAIISSGVSASAALARDAIAMNARKMNALFAALKKIGVERRQVQTSRLSLVREFKRSDQPGEPRVPVGYTARNDISVRLKDVQDTGGAIDALVAAGADRINGPRFTINDDNKLVQKARENAMQQATNLSSFYARSTGHSRAEIISIDESVGYLRNGPMSNVLVASGRPAGDSSTPVEAGEIQRSVSVTVKYRLVR